MRNNHITKVIAQINSFIGITEGLYGSENIAVKEAAQTAIEIVRIIERETSHLPFVVKADGIILKYPRSINVEIDNDGDILVLGEHSNDYLFQYSESSACAKKVIEILCPALSVLYMAQKTDICTTYVTYKK